MTIAEFERMGRFEAVDAVKVQVCRSMADELDAHPRNSQMWKVFLEAVEGTFAHGDDGDGLADLLESLRAPLGDSKA